MEQLISQILSAVKGAWKYRWYAMAIAWIVLVAGFSIIYTLPNKYQTSARVFVDTQSILKPLLAGMTTIPDVDQQVAIMSKTLLSRPNVERVMRMVDLDINARTLKEKEALASDLMEEITISGTSRNDIYTISYSNSDPELAKNVVQSLLTIFIESSFGDKKQDSANAVRFIDEQIRQYEEKLVAAENALKEFKLENQRFSLGREDSFGNRLAHAEDQLSQARLELTEAEQARNSIRSEVAGEAPRRISHSAAAQNSGLESRIQALTAKLDTYRLQYTEQHPDVVATKRLLEQLEERRRQEAKSGADAAAVDTPDGPVLQQLKIALSDAEARVAAMTARVNAYAARVERLKMQATAIPEIEARYAQLNRDYEVNKANYEKLVASRDAARLSGDLSATSEMISFRIIDPPTVPVKPVGPHRLRLFALLFVLALGAGVGIAFVLSQIRPTFVSLAQLREITGLPVLGSVSMNWTDAEKKRRSKSLMAFTASFAIMLALYGGAFGVLAMKS